MDYDWIEMMNYMQNLRQFCSRNVRRTEKGSISTSQELDLLSRISLSDVPLTPHELCGCMGLGKSAVSRLIEHLLKKELLTKEPARHRTLGGISIDFLSRTTTKSSRFKSTDPKYQRSKRKVETHLYLPV